jgi:hypothetical protein
VAAAPGQSVGQQQSQQQSTNVTRAQSTNVSRAQSTQDAATQNFSQSYIPEYSQTPILEAIAKQAQSMAPQVYQWGMDQFNKQQGNIDALMRNALSYASPQRVRADMGMAEAGVQQGAEAGRQSAIRDLQSYGIDPSSGRYAALDTASRVQAGAAAAGAGNQQRMSDFAQGTAMQNQAIATGAQNIQTGYGAGTGANALLGTAANLKYAPLGTTSGGTSVSSGQSTTTGDAQSTTTGDAQMTGESSGFNASQQYPPTTGLSGGMPATAIPGYSGFGGSVMAAKGGPVPDELSRSNGGAVDDVPASLTAGEFIIPKDVAAWKGQEFFYKLMAQVRKTRATSGNGSDETAVGYGAA